MLCVGLMIAYCFMPNVPSNAATFCNTARPIFYSRHDTLETRKAIDTHNRIGKRLCGWQGKRKAAVDANGNLVQNLQISVR